MLHTGCPERERQSTDFHTTQGNTQRAGKKKKARLQTPAPSSRANGIFSPLSSPLMENKLEAQIIILSASAVPFIYRAQSPSYINSLSLVTPLQGLEILQCSTKNRSETQEVKQAGSGHSAPHTAKPSAAPRRGQRGRCSTRHTVPLRSRELGRFAQGQEESW